MMGVTPVLGKLAGTPLDGSFEEREEGLAVRVVAKRWDGARCREH